MKVTPQEITQLAALARILLTGAEVTEFQNEVSEVITYNVKKLRKSELPVKLDTSTKLGQVDEPRPSLPVDLTLSNAPEEIRGLFVVPKVLE